MSILDELLLGFDAALDWPLDEPDEREAAAEISAAWDPAGGPAG